MAPRDFKSSIPGLLYPSDRDQAVKTGDRWLDSRRKDENIEGLWRIHDKLYDLTDFISSHPGGPTFLLASKGTDITEAFEAHHIKTTPEVLMKHFYVKDAKSPRIFPFTFHPDGFYRVLKGRVREILKGQPNQSSLKHSMTIDTLAILFLSFFVTACLQQSYFYTIIAGFFLTLCGNMAHNYFHRRDNIRMYYWDLMMISSYDWRITHSLSHHLYPNTVQDMELSLFEPWLDFIPTSPTGKLRRVFNVIYANLLFPFLFFLDFVKKWGLVFSGEYKLRLENFLVFAELALACYLTGDFVAGMYQWLVLHMVNSYVFHFIALTAAHHHPEIFHDGDTPRKDMDWGLHQVDAVRDRYHVTGAWFLANTTFGDHTLHHLFPTLDHSLLPQLYPVLEKTFKEFGLPWHMHTIGDLFTGAYRQMLRTKANPLPPWTKK